MLCCDVLHTAVVVHCACGLVCDYVVCCTLKKKNSAASILFQHNPHLNLPLFQLPMLAGLFTSRPLMHAFVHVRSVHAFTDSPSSTGAKLRHSLDTARSHLPARKHIQSPSKTLPVLTLSRWMILRLHWSVSSVQVNRTKAALSSHCREPAFSSVPATPSRVQQGQDKLEQPVGQHGLSA